MFVLCLLLFRHNGWGQSVEPVVPTDLELKEAAEEEAGQVWKKDDRDIERQVFRESLADFIKRRDRAAQARHRYDAARMAKADAQVKERLVGRGFDIVGSTPEAFTAFLRQESEATGRLVQAANIRVVD